MIICICMCRIGNMDTILTEKRQSRRTQRECIDLFEGERTYIESLAQSSQHNVRIFNIILHRKYYKLISRQKRVVIPPILKLWAIHASKLCWLVSCWVRKKREERKRERDWSTKPRVPHFGQRSDFEIPSRFIQLQASASCEFIQGTNKLSASVLVRDSLKCFLRVWKWNFQDSHDLLSGCWSTYLSKSIHKTNLLDFTKWVLIKRYSEIRRMTGLRRVATKWSRLERSLYVFAIRKGALAEESIGVQSAPTR